MIVFDGEKRDVLNLAFTPDGSTLAVGGGDPAIELWEVASGTVDARIGVDLRYCHDALRFDPSGQWLLVAGAQRPLVAHEVRGRCAIDLTANWFAIPFAISPTGRQIVHTHNSTHYRSIRMPEVTGSVPEWEVRIYPEYETYSLPVGLGFGPDGTHLVSAERTTSPERRDRPRVALRSAATGEVVAEAGVPILYPEGFAVSPVDACAVVRGGMSLFVYDTADLGAGPQKVTNDNRKYFTAIAFHPSGKFLAATSNDATVKLYDTETWTVTTTFAWNIGRLRSIAFSPDGLLAAAGSDTGKVVVWDVDV